MDWKKDHANLARHFAKLSRARVVLRKPSQRMSMQELLANPAVQGGVAPFVAGLIVAVLLGRFRLGGLAVVAAFATAVYFIAGFSFIPLSATRKIILLGFAAPLRGHRRRFRIQADAPGRRTLLTHRRRRRRRVGLLAGALAERAGARPAARMPPRCSRQPGSSLISEQRLAGDSVRAGAAGLALGAGTGVAAILRRGADLRPVRHRGRRGLGRVPPGADDHREAKPRRRDLHAQRLRSSRYCIAAAAMMLAQLPWYSVVVLALVPVAANLPLPAGSPLWLQAVLPSLYGLVVAGIACALAWHAGG